MKFKDAFPKMCTECRTPIDDREGWVGVVVAGSAWKNGVAVLEDGAELYQTAVYCPDHVPPLPEDKKL